jgi:RNA polymerase sigma-70 factor, ECF subfamily
MTDAKRQGQIARLLMQHRMGLYAFIFSCVRNHADAEDILQNVSVVVMESFEQLTSEEGFLPWVREIARRRILANRRENQREQPFDPDLVEALVDAAEAIDREKSAPMHHAALLACLESLPDESRQLIALRYQEGIGDATQLAHQFGYSIQSIYARIKRIKLSLKDCVEKRLMQDRF